MQSYADLGVYMLITIKTADSPFEFRALEVALEAICSYLSARTIELESAVYPALDMLTSKVIYFSASEVFIFIGKKVGKSCMTLE